MFLYRDRFYYNIILTNTYCGLPVRLLSCLILPLVVNMSLRHIVFSPPTKRSDDEEGHVLGLSQFFTSITRILTKVCGAVGRGPRRKCLDIGGFRIII